ncbi:glycoside hydrolase family 25 protein [Butyrivibrio proteoclasticus]|uniref:glycoside hydrolase family 25 protein n=1 Tax=Butyrivibrio proteoclasticus TaxID=43305 RepID=UPI0006872A93|nr:glycoside hydrolase family 25 protein [Butyrivibrio proteoclasticus]
MKNTSQDIKERRGIRNAHNIISIIFLSLVALLALSFSVILLIKNATLQREEDAVRSQLEALESEGYYTETQAKKLVEEATQEGMDIEAQSIRDSIQQKLEAGEGTTATIRSLFPDQLVVANAGRYYFFPIRDDIDHHPFGPEDFEFNEKGFLEYVGNSTAYNFKTGVDVSRFQGKIDWAKVAADGIDFAFVRVGLRGTTEGKLLEDDYYEDNLKGATENGLDVGVYFYSQAINEEEALEEAQMVLDLIEPYDIKYPVVIDVESAESDSARTNNMTTDEYEAVVKVFCETVKNAGYTPMVYGNVKSYTLLMDAYDVDDYDIWIAYYGTPLYYPYHFNVWQYTSTGTVNGIDGNVDLNICMTDY